MEGCHNCLGAMSLHSVPQCVSGPIRLNQALDCHLFPLAICYTLSKDCGFALGGKLMNSLMLVSLVVLQIAFLHSRFLLSHFTIHRHCVSEGH